MNCVVRDQRAEPEVLVGAQRKLRNTVVLIVEDHEDTCGFIKMVLKLEGFKVLSAISRDQAALFVEKVSVDVILLDYFMPGMSAFKFITLTRDNNPTARIVLMSAAGYARDAARMLGVAEVIEKPVTAEHIYRLLCME